jgi:TPR repeat protein
MRISLNWANVGAAVALATIIAQPASAEIHSVFQQVKVETSDQQASKRGLPYVTGLPISHKRLQTKNSLTASDEQNCFVSEGEKTVHPCSHPSFSKNVVVAQKNTEDSDQNTCFDVAASEIKKAERESTISACTRLIAAGHLNQYDLAAAYIFRAQVLRDMNPERALADFDRGIAISEGINSDPDGFVSGGVHWRADLRESLGDLAGARDDYSRILSKDCCDRFSYKGLARINEREVVAKSEKAPTAIKQAPLTECDLEAGSPSDINLPRGARGHFAADIDITKATKACSEALKTFPDDPRIMYELGRVRAQAKAHSEALPLYRAAADRGYVVSLSNMGQIYENGLGVPPNYPEALRLQRKAAELGHQEANVALGDMYLRGHGVAPSDCEAVQFYKKALSFGLSSAMQRLGDMYADGRCVGKNDLEAVRLYREAANLGNGSAVYRLGRAYEFGLGVNKDTSAAQQQYELAIELNMSAAKQELQRLKTAIAAARATPTTQTDKQVASKERVSLSAYDTVEYIEAEYEKATLCHSHNYIDWSPPILRFRYFGNCDRVYEEVREIDMRFVTKVETGVTSAGMFGGIKAWAVEIVCDELCITWTRNAVDSGRYEDAIIDYPLVTEIDANRIAKALSHLADLYRQHRPKGPFD